MTTIQEQIEILVALQDVELNLTRTDQLVKTLMDEAIDLDAKAAERETLVNAEKHELDTLKKAYRELDAETRLNSEKIAKSNAKLREVKTNKEYQSILKEIEDIQKKNSGIEDQMLEQLEQIESQEGTIAEKLAQLDGYRQSCQQKKADIEHRVDEAQQTISALNQQIVSIRAMAEPETITALDRVKTRVRGMAVAPAQGEVCMGCHMNIPAQLFNELLRFDELRFCPHCHRIIYWKEKDTE